MAVCRICSALRLVALAQISLLRSQASSSFSQVIGAVAAVAVLTHRKCQSSSEQSWQQARSLQPDMHCSH